MTPNDGEYDADSVAALIFTPDGRYLLQHRSDLPDVTFPNTWGLFGGAKDLGESALAALHRELIEELQFAPEVAQSFLVSDFDLRSQGGWFCRRAFFGVPIEESDIGSFVLGEGDALALFTIPQLTSLGEKIVPFDVCAILLHARYHA